MRVSGTGASSADAGATSAVVAALACGYRHLDCAAVYNNEHEIGPAIRASGVAREEVLWHCA